MAWEQPKTIKLYLHPPAADHITTLWPDFKVVSQPADPPQGVKPTGPGFHLLFGEEARCADWLATRYTVREDGIPVHAMRTTVDDFTVDAEAFCPWDETTAVLLKLTIYNASLAPERFTFGVLPRTGIAHYLAEIESQSYASYRSNLALWDMVVNTWAIDGDLLTDGTAALSMAAPEDTAIRWVDEHPVERFAKNYLELATTIPGRATTTVYLAFTLSGEPLQAGEYAYEEARAHTLARWQQALAPAHTWLRAPDDELRALFASLVCQSLQMFATTSTGAIKPRQGDRYHGVWPTEAIEFLRALDRIGLHELPAKAYAFFRDLQELDGEEAGRLNGYQSPVWLCHTGGMLYGLAYHLRMQRNRQLFLDWRKSILLSLDWMARQRAKTKNDNFPVGYGLFPPGPGNDWGMEGQGWCISDGVSFLGLREMVDTFRFFSDPEADALEAELADYWQCLTNTLEKVTADQRDRDEVYIPNVLGTRETYPPLGPYFADGPIMLVRAGIIPPRSELFEKIERYFRKRGWMLRNGLCALMTDPIFWGAFTDPWAGHVWYTSFPDFIWFYAWLARGEREKSARTLWAQIRYGGTAEHYLNERFADNDPTFCPWQPNASANGRLMCMLLDFFGEESRSTPAASSGEVLGNMVE